MAEPFLTEPNVPIWKIHFDLIVVVLRTPAVSSSIVKNQLEIKAYQTINLKGYWWSNKYPSEEQWIIWKEVTLHNPTYTVRNSRLVTLAYFQVYNYSPVNYMDSNLVSSSVKPWITICAYFQKQRSADKGPAVLRNLLPWTKHLVVYHLHLSRDMLLCFH